MPKKKTKLEGEHLPKLIGKTSYLKVDWKSWKKELPPKDQHIWIIIHLQNGYYTVLGEYFEEAIPYGCDQKGNMVIPPRVFRQVRFSDQSIPDVFLGSKDEKRLIGWGEMDKVDLPHEGKEPCIICKEKRCVC